MGIVFMIKCNETGECYIGSANTKKCYIGRKSAHRNIYNSECSSKQIIERGNYTFSIVEENEFIDIELRKREQYWIDTSHHIINKWSAYITPEQNEERIKLYREKNKEKSAEYWKEYYEKNKEKICLQQQEYYEKNKEYKSKKFVCECGGKYTQCHKSRHLKTKKHQNYLNELLF